MTGTTRTSSTPAWQRLSDLALRIGPADLAALAEAPGRFEALCHGVAGVTVDLSRQRVDAEVMKALIELGTAVDLPAAMRSLVAGEVVNGTENRPALHTALRAAPTERPAAVRDAVDSALTRTLHLAEGIRDGRVRGPRGRAITDVIHIGIGGSHLGPELLVDALPGPPPRAPRIRFLANVDGRVVAEMLRGLSPETTLVVIASKSFTTLESRVNAATVLAWLTERSPPGTDPMRQVIAVTARPDAARAMGVPDEQVLELWDWVGGRYSLWSAVGLPVAIHLGAEGFRALLAGARAMDRHALEAPIARNLPMLLALVGTWNFNFLGAQSHAVLPYARALRLLPAFLQQLEMESNAKSVHTDGARLELHSMPVLWGGEETNGQHAFHQFLHQGTRAFSADFVLCGHRPSTHADHHDWLVAHCLAQGEALMKGRTAASLQGDVLAAHRAMPGNRPSTTIVLERLDPATLGALLALYEHKVYCQGKIWQINPFDQWGVELGKTIGDAVHGALTAARSPGSRWGGLSRVTRHLIELIERQNIGPRAP